MLGARSGAIVTSIAGLHTQILDQAIRLNAVVLQPLASSRIHVVIVL